MCEVAVLNPQIDMTTPGAIAEGFYSPQHWSNSPPEISPHYANSPIASSPISSAQSPPSSFQHSPMMPVVHSPQMCVGSPVHSPLMHSGSPVHVNIKQEGEYNCSGDSTLCSILAARPAPPDLVPISVFNNIEGKRECLMFC